MRLSTPFRLCAAALADSITVETQDARPHLIPSVFLCPRTLHGCSYLHSATKPPNGQPLRKGITEALVTILFVRIWGLVLPIPQGLGLANSLRPWREFLGFPGR